MRPQNNYHILAVGIIYLIITIIQITVKGLLPAWLYFSITFVTIDITLCESLKYSINQLFSIYNFQIETLDFIESNIDVLRECNGVDSYLEILNKANKKKQKTYNRDECSKSLKFLNTLCRAVEFFEFFSCALMILISPLKAIPYDLQTNRIISIFTLLSFSVTLISLFFTRYFDSKNVFKVDNKELSRYYLDVIKKISIATDKVPEEDD